MIRRPLAVLAATAFLLLATAGVASAHVTVNPPSAAHGSFAKLTFRVPTEAADASTVKLEVRLPDPAASPIAFVSVQPHAGWSYQVTTTHLATPIESDDGPVTDVVSGVTWTANTAQDGIKPGEFDEFNVSAGPLSTTADRLVFKALQTYSNGQVVSWIDTGAGAEHPAPTLTLTAAGDATPGSAADDGGDDDSSAVAVAALVVAVLALVAGGAALVRAGRAGRP